MEEHIFKINGSPCCFKPWLIDAIVPYSTGEFDGMAAVITFSAQHEPIFIPLTDEEAKELASIL